jgi:hypothetical protein
LKVIYSSYWGSYLAVVAASLHLGYIDFNEYNAESISALPLFNKIKNEDLGEMLFIGTDEKKRDVYVIGSKKTGNILEKAIKGIADIYGYRKDLVLFIDLNSHMNIFLCIGIFLTKRLGLSKTGTTIILKGVEWKYDVLKRIVQYVKSQPIYEVAKPGVAK